MKCSNSIVFINPNLVFQRNDFFTTGIVYMPVTLATFVGYVHSQGYSCKVIDAFGEKPNQLWYKENFAFRGLRPQEICEKIPDDVVAICIYAGNVTYHESVMDIIKCIRKPFSSVPLIVLENSQAVTAYSLENVKKDFYEVGANFIITGDLEVNGLSLIEHIYTKSRDPYEPSQEKIKDLDTLPFPAWQYFSLENYWNLQYAHGPLTSDKYLPILSSRGCPYACRFCVIPATNDLKWRARSAAHVVDEMEFFYRTLGVQEYHFEDVDPTIHEERIQHIALEILKRSLKIRWKICSGTKAETLKQWKTLELMQASGCTFIAIAPESGSARLMKFINKPSDQNHIVGLIQSIKKLKMRSQAAFVIGFPGETPEDRLLTQRFIKQLVKAGLDEIAIYMITPVPGSAIYNQFSGYTTYSELNFSPAWRHDFSKLNRFRLKLYINFLIWKFMYSPLSVFRHFTNLLTRNFENKIEMTLFRALHMYVLTMKRLLKQGA